MRFFKRLVVPVMAVSFGFSAVCVCGTVPTKWQPITITPAIRAVLNDISPDSLKGNLSFIASDLLEGRNTPSRGLDLAAEYIAAQFRSAGIEPVGNDGYFQTANWAVAENNPDGFKIRVDSDVRQFNVEASAAEWDIPASVDASEAKVVKIDYLDENALKAATKEELDGKAVITSIPDYRTEPRDKWRDIFMGMRRFMMRMAELKPALVISVRRDALEARPEGRLIDPEHRERRGFTPNFAVITVHDRNLFQDYNEMKAGATAARVSAHVSADVEKPVKIRNVIGLLRGSDPRLKNTYVMVTAHYDHLGMSPTGSGDRIYNGANDDGSGTVSVIELAKALSKLKLRPRRSIIFMTFFGEEKGDLGSQYYGRHPIFPIADTVADVNLEQVGRTDSTEGPQLNNATMTGYDFTDMGPIFEMSGKQVGIKVYKDPANSDSYFSRSDNQALADKGVPAHTLCVAFEYPDYHGLGDEWPKVNYDNMAKVDRMVALGLLTIANNSRIPQWNRRNEKTAAYVKAWETRHSKSGEN